MTRAFANRTQAGQSLAQALLPLKLERPAWKVPVDG